MPINPVRAAAAALAAICLAVAPASAASAAGWRYEAGQAGLWTGGGFNGLALRCSGGALSLAFFGFPVRLESGLSYTVVVTVDGTARRFRTRPSQRRGAAGSTLSTELSGQAAADFVEALKRGRKAEVATPAGRYDLPLAGSGKALDALAKAGGCPG
ncbi:hypothetical protein [Jiella sonneratiae]|uniref:Invasion associated locus B family protein n=1 Tax=Jiella sonneratiae TaxID=2816856 RepID=A0ABS3J5L3_9HYPH|nr:hypothetical protein [Jiella sonneratiae]MBO0904952.1 hypothetical protein [Jiella sonneratiae]